ncbi:hypothetical protein AAFF_G00208670 [Aldrovandia affinis]|uniref:Uncharacterized protein n=1 Tax=Aldrovandia affinis TaxID=143900 RepID=A0AAD7R000_9TELE|nr:hypothetical protein AAFF_G00208670 [Aldrovandia affinis]
MSRAEAEPWRPGPRVTWRRRRRTGRTTWRPQNPGRCGTTPHTQDCVRDDERPALSEGTMSSACGTLTRPAAVRGGSWGPAGGRGAVGVLGHRPAQVHTREEQARLCELDSVKTAGCPFTRERWCAAFPLHSQTPQEPPSQVRDLLTLPNGSVWLSR